MLMRTTQHNPPSLPAINGFDENAYFSMGLITDRIPLSSSRCRSSKILLTSGWNDWDLHSFVIRSSPFSIQQTSENGIFSSLASWISFHLEIRLISSTKCFRILQTTNYQPQEHYVVAIHLVPGIAFGLIWYRRHQPGLASCFRSWKQEKRTRRCMHQIIWWTILLFIVFPREFCYPELFWYASHNSSSFYIEF